VLKKRLNLTMPYDLYEMLKAESDKMGIPVSAMINISVKEYIKQGSVVELTNMYKELIIKSQTEQ
jgi:hypothetical protein